MWIFPRSIYLGGIKSKRSSLLTTEFVGCLAGVITQGQAVGPMQPVPRMGAAMQFGPPLLGLHPAAPQLLQGGFLISMSIID